MSFVPSLLPIPNVLNVVCLSWRAAESALQREAAKDHSLFGEEYITKRFVANLRGALEDATSRGNIENAFLEDLAATFPDFTDYATLQSIANGLGAYMSHHERHSEATTGGDVGLVIVRPNIELGWNDEIQVGEYSRGLLAQAKLKGRVGRWGDFTRKQREVLPQRVEYLAILLYSLSAEGVLDEFRWQLCHNFRVEQVRTWLRSGEFPSTVNSETIITGLGNGELGTNDQTIIKEILTPSGSPSLTIRIDWPPGQRPRPVILLERKQAQIQQVRLLVR